jgi:hypothetical protein
MCFGGGQDKAVKQAEEQERRRQATIAENVGRVNQAFSGRQSQYDALGAALRAQLQTDLGRKTQDMARQNKFSLARSGLTGGSAAIDAGKVLSREAQDAAVSGERQVRGAVAGLQNQDEAARTNLISLAQSGGNIGNPAAQTANMLRANLGAAQNQNFVTNLGDAFGATGAAIKARRDADERRRGMQDATTYASAFSR